MRTAVKWVVGLVLAVGLLVYASSFFWPSYDWALRLPSPDGHYDLVVLRGDKAAFDDFFYHVYVFPRNSAPADRPKGTRVLYTYPWRGRHYLVYVYSGYATPLARWTGPASLALTLTTFTISSQCLSRLRYSIPGILCQRRYASGITIQLMCYRSGLTNR
jgi:hypothetical protein